MAYARIFKSGNSQAVRLPKEIRFEVGQVEIFRRGDEIALRERTASATDIFDLLASRASAAGTRRPEGPRSTRSIAASPISASSAGATGPASPRPIAIEPASASCPA